MNSPLTAVCFVNCCGSTTDCGTTGVLDWLYSADTPAHAMCQDDEDAVMRGAALTPWEEEVGESAQRGDQV